MRLQIDTTVVECIKWDHVQLRASWLQHSLIDIDIQVKWSITNLQDPPAPDLLQAHHELANIYLDTQIALCLKQNQEEEEGGRAHIIYMQQVWWLLGSDNPEAYHCRWFNKAFIYM
jgi:hypothetical protein